MIATISDSSILHQFPTIDHKVGSANSTGEELRDDDLKPTPARKALQIRAHNPNSSFKKVV